MRWGLRWLFLGVAPAFFSVVRITSYVDCAYTCVMFGRMIGFGHTWKKGSLYGYTLNMIHMLKVHDRKTLEAAAVSRVTFRSELAKAIRGLDGGAARDLYLWCGEKYGRKYGGMIREVFLSAGWRAVTPCPMQDPPSDN